MNISGSLQSGHIRTPVFHWDPHPAEENIRGSGPTRVCLSPIHVASTLPECKKLSFSVFGSKRTALKGDLFEVRICVHPPRIIIALFCTPRSRVCTDANQAPTAPCTLAWKAPEVCLLLLPTGTSLPQGLARHLGMDSWGIWQACGPFTEQCF